MARGPPAPACGVGAYAYLAGGCGVAGGRGVAGDGGVAGVVGVAPGAAPTGAEEHCRTLPTPLLMMMVLALPLALLMMMVLAVAAAAAAAAVHVAAVVGDGAVGAAAWTGVASIGP